MSAQHTSHNSERTPSSQGRHLGLDISDILPALSNLDERLVDLEEALEPLFDNFDEVLHCTPLLERAKLYVLATYSLESMVYAHLKLAGEQDPQQHPVMHELKRVQETMQAIKLAEEPSMEDPPGHQSSAPKVNMVAATRIIRSDLADHRQTSNDALMARLKEKITKERALAQERGQTKQAAGEPSSANQGDGPSHQKAKNGERQGRFQSSSFRPKTAGNRQ